MSATLVCVLAVIAGAPAHAAQPVADPRTQPVTVSVPLRTITSPDAKGMNGIVEIRLGRSAPFAVMLDTGSVGLRVFPGAWDRTPAGVRTTETPISVPSDGGTTKGLLGRAPFTIGGVTSTRSVGFQFVNTDSPYIGQWARRGVFGILGVGTGRYALPNPLSTLPGSVGQHWSLRFGGEPATRQPGAGTLVLGAEPPADATATFTLPPLGPDSYGALLWDDHKASGCWAFGRGPEQCVDTWFDSGFDVMRVKGSAFARIPRTPADAVRTGTPVSMSASGSSFTAWRFDAGTTQSLDFVRVLPKGRAQINTGNALFFQYTVTYDVERGLVALSRPRQP
jgi:hypothetical protein